MLSKGATSFAYPIDRAIVAAVKADTGAGGLLAPGALLLNAAAPVWSGKAGNGATLDYIVLGDSSETDEPAAATFDGYGFANVVTLHVWTKDTSRKSATRILGRLLTLLHRRPLYLTQPDGVTPLARIRGTFSTVTILLDPGGDVTHAVGRYEVTSHQSAT
jgi:hypothetical protein